MDNKLWMNYESVSVQEDLELRYVLSPNNLIFNFLLKKIILKNSLIFTYNCSLAIINLFLLYKFSTIFPSALHFPLWPHESEMKEDYNLFGTPLMQGGFCSNPFYLDPLQGIYSSYIYIYMYV